MYAVAKKERNGGREKGLDLTKKKKEKEKEKEATQKKQRKEEKQPDAEESRGAFGGGREKEGDRLNK